MEISAMMLVNFDEINLFLKQGNNFSAWKEWINLVIINDTKILVSEGRRN